MIDWISTHIPPWVWIALIAHGVITGTVAYLILLERKVASWAQDRLGPNRVGPGGLLQPIADGIKMLVKEDYRARHTDKILFTIAPALMMITVIISIATIPWGGTVERKLTVDVPQGVDVAQAVKDKLPGGAVVTQPGQPYDAAPLLKADGEVVPARRVVDVTYRWAFQVARLDIGVLFILAVLSLAVYGVVIGGWASNNKYSFLGGLRATAQMISYEIPLGLAVLTVVAMFGTMDLTSIVDRQVHYWGGWMPAWNVFCQPLAFLMFLVCIHAEANRAPFDLAEAEQELVGGYHTEYSSMRFGLFFLAEYAGMITTSAVCVVLFFGGWHLPWLDEVWPALSGVVGPDGHIATQDVGATQSILIAILRALILYGKTMFFIFVFMWVRWSLPRFRFDQLMQLAWHGMIPVALGILAMTAVVLYFASDPANSPAARARIQLPTGGYALGPITGKMALWLLVGNVAVIVLTAVGKKVLPDLPDTNRRVRVPGSRFTHTPLPARLTPQPTTGNVIVVTPTTPAVPTAAAPV